MGVLPPCAPLATPYVPFQQNNPQTYTAKKGVIRGTLFPGLDLPFMGKVNNTELSNTPMHELQALSFALVELGLYLDTHPKDTQALELFHSYHELMDKGIAQYEATYGPLIQKNSSKNGSYDWLNNPWPWDYEANATKEG
jgi:spore coat protein JB